MSSTPTSSHTSHASTVPIYLVRPYTVEFECEDGPRQLLEVECPRRDCGMVFWVPPSWATLQSGHGKLTVWTRACPGCFRVGWIPGHKPEPVQEGILGKPRVVFPRKKRL